MNVDSEVQAGGKNPDIGYIVCPVCGFDGAPVREQKISRRAYIVCDECGTQVFTRWTQGNRAIRARMRPLNAPPEKAAAPAPVAVAAAKKEDTTIFDLLLSGNE